MFCNGGFPKGCVSELMASGRGRVLMRAAMKGPDDMLPIVKNIWGEVELGGYEGGVVERPRLNADVLDLRTGVIPENSILPHQELAYSDKVPTFLAFGCFQAAERGGITTLTDMKQVQQLLPHGLLGKLWDLGLSYVYNYHSNAFHQHAEAPVPYFDPAQWDNQWETHRSFHSRTPDRVRLCTTRPAFALHPYSKQVGLLMSVISFHGFNYGSDQWKRFKPLDRPMHCTWGDGSEINDEEFGLMREAYTQATEHVVLGLGDLLVLDNYRFAHGRTAYEGTRIMGGLLSENLPRTNLCPVPEPTVVRPTWTSLATVPKEDYMKSKSEYLRSAEPPYIANRMLNLLESLGASNSIPGYPVTTKEHCVQTASRALRDGSDDETVVCALLHDVGEYLCPHAHGAFAASILMPFVSPLNLWMVENHSVFEGYYYRAHMGDDPNGRDKFRGHAAFEQTCRFAEWDSQSFDAQYPSYPLSVFAPMLHNIFHRPPFWWDLDGERASRVSVSKQVQCEHLRAPSTSEEGTAAPVPDT